MAPNNNFFFHTPKVLQFPKKVFQLHQRKTIRRYDNQRAPKRSTVVTLDVKVKGATTKFLGITLYIVIITYVTFQLKLLTANFVLIINYNHRVDTI